MLDVRSRLVNLQLRYALCDVSFNLLRNWISVQLKVSITNLIVSFCRAPDYNGSLNITELIISLLFTLSKYNLTLSH